jgi:hypothetical protein
MPFEIERVRIQPDAFVLDFTKLVAPARAAPLANYRIEIFTHFCQEYDGGLEVDQATPRTVAAKLASGGRSARLDVEGIVARHVHAFELRGIESKDGAELLHTRAYYTVNHIPK